MAEEECRLLALPPEICNIIYEVVLTVPQNRFGIVEFGKRPRSGNNVHTYSIKALLQTCKEVYNEASTMFYSLNTLAISYLQVNAFLRATSPSRLACIKHLAIKDKSLDLSRFRWVEHLHGLPCLEILTVMLCDVHPDDAEEQEQPTRIVMMSGKAAAFPNLREIRIMALGRLSDWEQEDLEEAEESLEAVLMRGCGMIRLQSTLLD